MAKLILINGKKRTGKDYIANYIKEKLKRKKKKVEILHFADPVKEVLCITFKIGIDELDNLKNSNTIIFNNLTMRNILQNFGTDAMQNIFWKNIWVDLIKFKIRKSNADYILIPDFRFKHEFLENSITLKITSDNSIEDSHISEHDLDDFEFNYTIKNDCDASKNKDLKKFIKQISE